MGAGVEPGADGSRVPKQIERMGALHARGFGNRDHDTTATAAAIKRPYRSIRGGKTSEVGASAYSCSCANTVLWINHRRSIARV